MRTVSVQEAETQLRMLIANLKPGEDVLITEHDRPVARLVAEPWSPRRPRRPGTAVGELTIVEDDDSYLAEFKEYMP